MFDQAVRDKVSFLNYGEQAAGVLPMGADGRDTYSQVLANSNLAYAWLDFILSAESQAVLAKYGFSAA